MSRRCISRHQSTLSINNYDCIGFDLDHTLCRYNLGPMIRLIYSLLAEFLVVHKGYDASIKKRNFDEDSDFVCKGLTLDCEHGNLLRLGRDGFVLMATHGSRRMNDAEIERVYGRNRKNHVGSEYSQHLAEFGPQNLLHLRPLLHTFLDYFDIVVSLLCARIVDVIDSINNAGQPMEEYFFWPDVHEGLRDLFTRTQFAADQGGYFPAIKANPELYIMRRKPEFIEWLRMLRQNGKFLYVITGSHIDFASLVATYSLGEDWKDLFDIVIFFARKPSFFLKERPFWKLDGSKEVESIEGWQDLEIGEYYSQGNWRTLNEFFEYCTEWQPSSSLYFGDNILQDILAPKKFTKSIDSIAVCEEMMAEGMYNFGPSHPHMTDIVSNMWGSFFHCPNRKHSSFTETIRKLSSPAFQGSCKTSVNAATISNEVRRAISLRRVSSMRSSKVKEVKHSRQPLSEPVSRGSTPSLGSSEETVAQIATTKKVSEPPAGPARINTLWGLFIRDYAVMCIPDIEVLIDYPIDYHFPAFGKNYKGKNSGESGFFPADPSSLHSPV